MADGNISKGHTIKDSQWPDGANSDWEFDVECFKTLTFGVAWVVAASGRVVEAFVELCWAFVWVGFVKGFELGSGGCFEDLTLWAFGFEHDAFKSWASTTIVDTSEVLA